jgi:hypothetical protein
LAETDTPSPILDPAQEPPRAEEVRVQVKRLRQENHQRRLLRFGAAQYRDVPILADLDRVKQIAPTA